MSEEPPSLYERAMRAVDLGKPVTLGVSADDVRAAIAATQMSVEWTPEMQHAEQEADNLYRTLGMAFARSSYHWSGPMTVTKDDPEPTAQP